MAPHRPQRGPWTGIVGAAVAIAAHSSLLIATPQALAQGKTSAVVLGVRSIEGDDVIARNLTAGLRRAAAKVAQWEVSDQELSLAQMTLAYGCDEADADCIAQVADNLNADRIVYGTIRRTSTANDADFAVTLYLFNAQTGEVERFLTDTIARSSRGPHFLRTRALHYIGHLTGMHRFGALRVVANVAGAEVSLNGQPLGLTEQDGVFVDGEVPAGGHTVQVKTEGYQDFSKQVEIVPGEEASLRVLLVDGTAEPPASQGPDRPFNWKGWTAIGVGAVSFGITVYGWSRISAIGEAGPIDLFGSNSTWEEYRSRVPAPLDACDAARGDPDSGIGGSSYGLTDSELAEVQDLCDEADFWSVAQWVFLGVGVASTALGTYLLLQPQRDEPEDASNAKAGTGIFFTPSVGRRHGHLRATVRF